MKRLRKFFQLPRNDQTLLLKALLLLWMLKIGLFLLPYRFYSSCLKRWTVTRPGGGDIDRSFLDRVAWAVTAASRYVLGKHHCLIQAYAVQILLARRGFPSQLCLGVRKDDTAGLKAHAWVESDGIRVIGGSDVEQYSILTSAKGKKS